MSYKIIAKFIRRTKFNIPDTNTFFNLSAFKFNGFWQCMDTPRDKEYLIKLLKKKNAPWKK